MKKRMKQSAKLDASKMLGFKLIDETGDSTPRNIVSVPVRMGAKRGKKPSYKVSKRAG